MSDTQLSEDVLRERLAAARDAYHKLMLGKQARVVVDTDGTRVEYTAANSGKLNAYIRTLIDAIDALSATSVPVYRGPLGFVL